MAIREDDQKLKDMMRAIELGEIEEDILEGDSEDYDDMGGINSLKRRAPSIKMASETPEEEFELELGTVIREYNDLKEKGLIKDISIEEYIDKYLSKKKLMNKKIALGEGYKSPELNSMSMSMFGKPVKLLTPDEIDQLRQAYDDSKGRTEAMYGGRMQYADGTEEQARQARSELPKNKIILDKSGLPEAMRKDTTTGEGKTFFNMDDYVMIKLPNGEVRYVKKENKAKGGIAGVL